MPKWVVFSLIGLSAIALACGGGPTTGPGEDTSSKKNGHTVKFEVTGDGVSTASNISYGIGGNISQANGSSLPWQQTSDTNDALITASLTAQAGEGSGTISCRISIDGKEKVKNSSQGEFAVVTCTS